MIGRFALVAIATAVVVLALVLTIVYFLLTAGSTP